MSNPSIHKSESKQNLWNNHADTKTIFKKNAWLGEVNDQKPQERSLEAV